MIFWNEDERRLRALWRLLLHVILLVGLAAVPVLLIAEPLTALHRRNLFLAGWEHEPYDRVVNIIVGPFLAAAIVASVALAARWLDRRRFEELTGRVDAAWFGHLGIGLAVGALLMSAVFGIEAALGWVVWTGTGVSNVAGVSLTLSLAFSLVKVLCVGTYEEVVSRGYHLRNLSEGLNLPLGIALSSAVFASLHALNDNATWMSTLGLCVNAGMFAAAFLATGRLSTAIGLHVAWNLFEGAVFGFPVSGDKEGASLLGIEQLGPDLLTGGAFGPEGGCIGIGASLAGIAIFAAWARRRR